MASILRVEVEIKQETSMDQTASRIPLKRRLTFPGVHDVVAQKVEHFWHRTDYNNISTQVWL
jgi:hypothetical protein